MKPNTVFAGAGAAIALGLSAAAMSAGPAHAGLVQSNPLAYLQTIFDQASIEADTGGRGIEINLLSSQTIFGPTDNIDGAAITALVSAAGLTNSLTIPVFYIDSYASASTVGLGDVGDNGVTVLTSYQQDLQVHPEEHDVADCTADNGFDCYYIIPAVTAADIPRGWLDSAAVVAHEIGHDLGLQHSNGGLMNAFTPTWDNFFAPRDYALTDAQVQTILQSAFVQTAADGQRFIDIAPYSVLAASAAVPEPATWLYMVVALGFCGGAIRRARRAGRDLAPARTIRA